MLNITVATYVMRGAERIENRGVFISGSVKHDITIQSMLIMYSLTLIVSDNKHVNLTSVNKHISIVMYSLSSKTTKIQMIELLV